MSERVNIIVLKWGDRYGVHYVNNLYHGVRKHLHRPFRFVCVTDDPTGLAPDIDPHPIPENPGIPDWPNVFLKLLVTADGFADLRGPTMFMDIDIAITGDIDCFFDYKPGRNVIIHNWIERRKTLFRKAPAIGNSSVFRFEAGQSQYIYDTFLQEMDDAIDRSKYCTEQAFLTYAMRERYWWPDAWVSSFKRHCMRMFPFNLFLPPTLPGETRILVFHGRPDPDQAIQGYRGKRVHHHSLPAPWIGEYWQARKSIPRDGE